jgi:hypothetical protein
MGKGLGVGKVSVQSFSEVSNQDVASLQVSTNPYSPLKSTSFWSHFPLADPLNSAGLAR